MKSYQFDQFKDFFEFYLKENSFSQKGQKVTLHDLANRLGYNSPSSLSMIANGSRLPSDALLNAIFQEWDIPATERERIRLKVEIEKRARKGKDSYELITRLNQLNPYYKIDVKTFSLIRDWYVLVIKLLVETPDFNEDPTWISAKLRRKVTPAQAKKALALLEEGGLIARDPVTQKYKAVQDKTETTHDIPSEAIRENHKGMIARAQEALEEQTIGMRNFNALTLQFDVAQMNQAKHDIREFVKLFNEKYSSTESKQVYQLNVQLFEHSNGGTKNEH